MMSSRSSGSDRRVRFFYLFVALLALLALYPYFETATSRLAFMVTFALAIPFAGVYAAGGRRRDLVIAGALCIPAQLSNLELLAGVEILPGVILPAFFTLLFFVFTIYVIVSRLLRREEVTLDVLFGAAAVYLLIGLMWTMAYVLLENLRSGSFMVAAGGTPMLPDLLYFSFVTLTTLGYGDILPVTSQAQSLAILEAVTGVLYLAFLIGRLVGAYLHAKQDAGRSR